MGPPPVLLVYSSIVVLPDHRQGGRNSEQLSRIRIPANPPAAGEEELDRLGLALTDMLKPVLTPGAIHGLTFLPI